METATMPKPKKKQAEKQPGRPSNAPGDGAQQVSVSLYKDDVDYLERYRLAKKFRTRSLALQQMVQEHKDYFEGDSNKK